MGKSIDYSVERIEQLLKDSGLSGGEFAKKCGLSANTISLAKRGKRLSIKSAKKIAKAWNVSLDYLFEASDIRNSDCAIAETINRHFNPTTTNVDIGRTVYFLPVLGISVPLDEYFAKSRKVVPAILSKKLRQSLQDQLQKDFVKGIARGVRKRHEYVMIPIEVFKNAQDIDDLCAEVERLEKE